MTTTIAITQTNRLIGKVVGHQSIASTQRYAHLADDKLMAAVSAGASKPDVSWSKGA